MTVLTLLVTFLDDLESRLEERSFLMERNTMMDVQALEKLCNDLTNASAGDRCRVTAEMLLLTVRMHSYDWRLHR